MAVRRKEYGSTVVLQLKGSFYDVDELQKAIMDDAARDNRHMVLNMAECQMMNSIAIGAMMRGYANYRGRGGEIRLCSLPKRIDDLLTMTKLRQVFKVFDTEEDAVASFDSEAAASS